MTSLLKTMLIGNAGKDPELKNANGTEVVNLSFAVDQSYKKNGEKVERTEWINVSFFGKLAEVVAKYVRKGQKCYVEGSLRTDEYTKDGVKCYSTKVIAKELQMLGGKPTSQVETPVADEFDSSIPF